MGCADAKRGFRLSLPALSRFGALVIMAIACVAIVGWTLDLPLLTSYWPGLARMSVITASCFILAAVALLSANPAARTLEQVGKVTRVAGIAIAAAGGVALASYLPGGIQDILPPDFRGGFILGPLAGRIAPGTALSFLLFSCALLTPQPRLGGFSAILVAGGMLISMLALTGYVYGVEALYRIGPFTAMALPTAIAFATLFWSLALARPDQGWVSLIVGTGTGGRVARRLLPAIILVPMLLGWIAVRLVVSDPLAAPFAIAVLTISIIFLLGMIVCTLSAWLTKTELALKQYDQTLLESEMMARSIIATSLDAFVQLDGNGIILEWNPQAERIFGWSRSEAVGQAFEKFLSSRRGSVSPIGSTPPSTGRSATPRSWANASS